MSAVRGHAAVAAGGAGPVPGARGAAVEAGDQQGGQQEAAGLRPGLRPAPAPAARPRHAGHPVARPRAVAAAHQAAGLAGAAAGGRAVPAPQSRRGRGPAAAQPRPGAAAGTRGDLARLPPARPRQLPSHEPAPHPQQPAASCKAGVQLLGCPDCCCSHIRAKK